MRCPFVCLSRSKILSKRIDMFKIILLPGSHIIVLTRDIDIANLVHKEWKLVRFTGK